VILRRPPTRAAQAGRRNWREIREGQPVTISELIAKLQTIQEARGDLPVFVYDDGRTEWHLPNLTYVEYDLDTTWWHTVYFQDVPGDPSEFVAIGFADCVLRE